MSDKATQTAVPGQPVLPPPEFPVTWDDPQDAKITWLTFSQYRASIRPLLFAVINLILNYEFLHRREHEFPPV